MADSTAERKQTIVLAAIQQASAALVSLAHIAREGEHDDTPNTIELLADALKLAIEAEAPTESEPGDVNQLHGALTRFLDGWAG